MEPIIKVLLADDHAVLRAELRVMLDRIDGIELVGEAADGRTAFEMAGSLSPDIPLIDIDMPGIDGIEATHCIVDGGPGTRVIILSKPAEPDYVSRAWRAGASGYLLKNATPAEVALALRADMTGGMPLGSRGFRGVMAPPRPGPLEQLPARQREGLRPIAESRHTRRIAAQLGLNAKTVEAHRAALMRRLDIRDVPTLVRLAMREGLVQWQPSHSGRCTAHARQATGISLGCR